MQLRHLTDDDVAGAVAAFQASLGSPLSDHDDRYRRYWNVPTSLVTVADDGRVLGVAARYAARLTAVGGAELRCSAVPSVGVRPDAQRRGIGRQLLERQVVEAAERGDAVLALNASETEIYGRFGYGPISTWWSVEADPRTLVWRDDAPRAAPGAIEEVDAETAHDLLPALHERCMGRWGGELSRPDGWWFSRLLPRPNQPANTFAVLRGDDGTVEAAATYGVRQRFDDLGFANEVDLRDLVGLDVRREALLLRWLLERRLVGRVTVERCNPRTPVKWMLAEGRRLRTTTAEDAVWVRVADVPAAVTARTTLATGAVDVAVTDALVPTNARTWRIAADGEGGLVCEPSSAAPALTLDVQLLAPVLWGYATATRLAAADRLAVHDAAGPATLDRLMAVVAPAWCSTGF